MGNATERSRHSSDNVHPERSEAKSKGPELNSEQETERGPFQIIVLLRPLWENHMGIRNVIQYFGEKAITERRAKNLEKNLPANITVAEIKQTAADARDQATRPNAFTDPRDYAYKAAAYELIASRRTDNFSK
jgi:hypothetical protein